jgi:origin recognition complex subunit 2
VLAVHSIDGAALRAREDQTALSMLAQAPWVHLVATVDHINAGLGWSQWQLRRFNWAWHEAYTFEGYAEEDAIAPARVAAGRRRASTSAGVGYVLQSVTPNHRSIWRVLARAQLDQDAALGLTFNDWLGRCQEAMYVRDDRGLHLSLGELLDHDIVKTKIAASDGRKYYYIPHPPATIRAFLHAP